MKLVLLILISLFFGTISTSGQNGTCHQSTSGTDFWIGFLEITAYTDFSHNELAVRYGEITVASEVESDFKIIIGNGSYGGIYHVNANSIRKVKIDFASIDYGHHPYGLHLISDHPVNVYAHCYTGYCSESTLIYPTNLLGRDYLAMCYRPEEQNPLTYQNGTGTIQSYSQLLIIATEDSTVIDITLPKDAGGLGLSSTTSTVMPRFDPDWNFDNPNYNRYTSGVNLNKGDTYLLMTFPRASDRYTGDATGSYIHSNRPIALFSGCNYTRIKPNLSGKIGHLYEQMPTVELWGQKFVAVPLKLSNMETFRVLASNDNTEIHIQNSPPITLSKRGDFHEFTVENAEPSVIESNKPVLVAQYSGSTSNDTPSMVIVNPVGQESEKASFAAIDFSHEGITDPAEGVHYVDIVAKNDAAGKINLDGSPVSFQSVSSSGYSYAQLKICSGFHLIESTEPGKGFLANSYGYWNGFTRSYGIHQDFNPGLDLEINLNMGGKKPYVICDGTLLDAGLGFDTYKWSNGPATRLIPPHSSGWYKVTVSTRGGCILTDSIQVQVNKPVVNLGQQRAICRPGSIVLDAGGPFASYIWDTGQTSQQITVSQPRTYRVKVTDEYGCKGKDQVLITSVEKPVLDLTKLDTLVCGKSGVLDVKADKGNFSVERMSDHSIFNDLNVEVPDFGTYPLKIRATDEFSCYTDSVIKVGFHKIPSVDFSVDSLSCYGYNLNAGYIGDAKVDLSEFTWIFRGDTIKKAIGANSVFIPLGTDKVTRELKLIVTENGCSNEKTLGNIKVIPFLQMRAADSTGCEPFTAQFSTNNNEPVDYLWDFGDGSGTTGTPNPSHRYNSNGFYAVKLKVTSAQGCINEVRIDSMIFVARNPHAAFSTDNRTLQRQASFINESTGAVNYKWDFGDTETSEEINPVHPYSNYGKFTVLLKALNEYSCSDTVSHTILVAFEKLFPPNAFSPNAPNPIDREFKLTTDGVSAEGYHFVIISRWNDIVFETKNEIRGWNGRMKNGDYAPAGNYVWLLDFVDLPGKRHDQTGTVTLVY